MLIENNPDSFKKIWILGAGKFGQLALQRILRRWPEVEITLVDNRVRVSVTGKVTCINEEGIDWLVKNMVRDDGSVDMIIPSLPVHMAAEWLKEKSIKNYSVLPASLPESLLLKFPNPIQNGSSQVYVSHADFFCPDNCGEPEVVCSHTGRARGENMFQLLSNIGDSAFVPLIVRSYQLCPGVGGIYPKDMWKLLDFAQSSLNRSLLIATACRCHGVVDGLQLDRQ